MHGPLIAPEMTPPSEPASSPLDIVISEFSVTAFLPTRNTVFDAVGIFVWLSWAMLGYGTGTTAGPAGVLQTSGNATH